MLDQTAENYSQYFNVNLEEKLKPVNQSIDEMLTRLEEFEAMVAMVQQERCNSIGMTGALSETIDRRKEFKELCRRIDALEVVLGHAKNNINVLETKVGAAEKHLGVVDGTARLKNLLSPFFKRNPETNSNVGNEEMEIFSTEKYFSGPQEHG